VEPEAGAVVAAPVAAVLVVADGVALAPPQALSSRPIATTPGSHLLAILTRIGSIPP
jgi:hypothetical protein